MTPFLLLFLVMLLTEPRGVRCQAVALMVVVAA